MRRRLPGSGRWSGRWRRWALSLWIAGACTLAAAEAPPRFELGTEIFTPPEGAPLSRYVLTLDAHRLSFLPPARWRVRPVARERRVVMSPIDGSAQLSFRLWPDFPARSSTLKREDVAPLVEQRFPGARIQGSHVSPTAAGTGIALELELPSAPGMVQLDAQIVFVPLAIGLLEIQFIGVPDQIDRARPEYQRFLSSLTLKTQPNTPPTAVK